MPLSSTVPFRVAEFVVMFDANPVVTVGGEAVESHVPDRVYV